MLPPAFPAGPRDTGTGSDRPVPEREKAGAGARRGLPESARLPAGGWAVDRPPVRRPRQRATSSSIACPVRRTFSRSSRVPLACRLSVAPVARSLRSETRGRRTSRCGYRRVPGAFLGGSAAGPAARHASAPPWRVRALPSRGSRRWVEARTIVQRSRSAAKVHRRGKRGGPEAERRARTRTTERRSSITRGSGRPVGVLGQCGGRRPAAGCRGRASCGQAREAPGSVRGVGPRGNGLRRGEPGDRARRAGGGDPLTGQDTGSPRALTSPFPAGDGRAGDDHPVATERSRRPPGLTPWTGTAPGATGRAPRGPADDAGPRGRSAAAGEDAAGWIMGVLGISRSTTGRSESGRRSAGSPIPAVRPAGNQARYAPSTPAPQRASRRVSARSREGRRAAGAFATVPVWAAGVTAGVAARASPPRQARYAPSTPAPQRATRRVSARSGPGRCATAGTRAGAGAAAGLAPAGRGRAGGACGTERSGCRRAVPRR